MIVLLSQQNLVSNIALQPLEMHIASVYCVAGTKMQVDFKDGCGTSTQRNTAIYASVVSQINWGPLDIKAGGPRPK